MQCSSNLSTLHGNCSCRPNSQPMFRVLEQYFDCFSFLGRTSWEPPPGVCSSTKCWATTKTKEMHICPTKGLIPRTHNIGARDWSRPRQGWECQRVPCTTKPEDPPTIFGISLVLSSFYSKLFQKLLILYTVSPERMHLSSGLTHVRSRSIL
jgi:hypothetical protein